MLDPGNARGPSTTIWRPPGVRPAYATTLARAKGTASEAGLEQIAALHSTQTAIRDKVHTLARSGTAAAIALLNKEEIPAWRTLRASTAAADRYRAQGRICGATPPGTKRSASSGWSAGWRCWPWPWRRGLGWAMARTLHRELGGDPPRARRPLRRVAGATCTCDDRSRRRGVPVGLMAGWRACRAACATLVAHVRDASLSITHASSEIAQGNQDLSARTESQASALEQTAASMEELGATVRQKRR